MPPLLRCQLQPCFDIATLPPYAWRCRRDAICLFRLCCLFYIMLLRLSAIFRADYATFSPMLLYDADAAMSPMLIRDYAI